MPVSFRLSIRVLLVLSGRIAARTSSKPTARCGFASKYPVGIAATFLYRFRIIWAVSLPMVYPSFAKAFPMAAAVCFPCAACIRMPPRISRSSKLLSAWGVVSLRSLSRISLIWSSAFSSSALYSSSGICCKRLLSARTSSRFRYSAVAVLIRVLAERPHVSCPRAF